MPSELLHPVSQVRELEFRHPVSQVKKSREEIHSYLQMRLAEEYGPHEIEEEAAVLRLFGLIPEDFDYERCVLAFLTQEIGGFYDPQKRQMVLPKDGASTTWQAGILLHELDHALQDQHFDLKRLMSRVKDNDDQTLAHQALVEGDAMLVMGEALRRQGSQGFPPEEGDDSKNSLPCEIPDKLRESFAFPYQAGLSFVLSRRQARGWGAVNELYEHLPLSSEQILHPEAWGTPANRPHEISREDLARSLFPWTSTNVMGEWGWHLVLGPHAAQGWGGDRYWLLYDPSNRQSAKWLSVVVWDTLADAKEFHEAWQNRFGAFKEMRIWRKAKQVWLGIHVDDEVWQAWLQGFAN